MNKRQIFLKFCKCVVIPIGTDYQITFFKDNKEDFKEGPDSEDQSS